MKNLMKNALRAAKPDFVCSGLLFVISAVCHLSAACSTSLPGGQSGAVLASASRTSGVAPLAVHFSVLYPDAASQTQFLETHYTWDFGDPLSGAWANSGKPGNHATGGAAAHVYETPGTYTVRLVSSNRTGVIATRSFVITVLDPETVYAGTNTVCVSDSVSADFTGAPTGSIQIATDNIADITPLATPGRRILFRRGSAWTVGALEWPAGSGPVTIGAFGPAAGHCALGIASNAPHFTVTNGSFLPLNYKQDWRVMDLALSDPARSNGTVTGAMEMERLLFLRLRIKGFSSGLGWSHWNTDVPMPIDSMAVVSCDVSDSAVNVLYLGAERLALLGNRAYNARTSHVVRVWQSWYGVISHNDFSGSSLDNTAGRHALKFHGPKEIELTPADGNGHLRYRSELTVISDNIFGSSGPWPVNIAAQDAGSDERLSWIVFERNRYHADHGLASATPVQAGVRIAARNVAVRNNIVDGAMSSADFTGIWVVNEGPVPPASGIYIYNNTVFRADNLTGNIREGIRVDTNTTAVFVRNNLVSFPGAAVPVFLLRDHSSNVVAGANLMTNAAGFRNPLDAFPARRDFSQPAGSPGIDRGMDLPVFESFNGAPRVAGAYDIGAFEEAP